MTLDPQTKNTLIEAYNEAPKAVQQLIASGKLTSFIGKLQIEFRLSDNAALQIGNAIVLIVLGGTEPDEFMDDLLSIDDLPDGAAGAIFERLGKEILEPLAEASPQRTILPQKPPAPNPAPVSARPLATPTTEPPPKPQVPLPQKPPAPQMPKPMPQNASKPDLSIPELPPEPTHMELKAHTMAQDAAALGAPVSKPPPTTPKMPPPVSKPMSSPLGAALEAVQQKQPMNNAPKPVVPQPTPTQKPAAPAKPAPLPPQNGKPLDPYREPIE